MRTPLTLAFCGLLGLAPAALAQSEPAPAISAGADEAPAPAPSRSGQIVVVPPEAYQRVADEAGEIYTSRGYKGVVPGIRDESDVAAKNQEAAPSPDARPVVEWVGFQPFPTYSRVFIQITGDFTFGVTRPDTDRIEVRVFGADVSTTNDLHELITRNFPTAVDRVTVSTSTADQGSVIVNVFLKAPVGYLYRQDGGYVFIDVEL
jgi:hypothetical protein